MPEFDDRDAALVAERVILRDKIDGPRIGDTVIFAGGERRLICHVWDFEPFNIQTCQGGSFHLCPWGAGRGVETMIPARVFSCTEPAPRTYPKICG